MRKLRYRVRDGAFLRRLMDHPAPSGTRHTCRSLARAAGISATKASNLITGSRPTVPPEIATRIAEAVAAPVTAIFEPTMFVNANADRESDRVDDPRSALSACPAGRAHELEQHD